MDCEITSAAMQKLLGIGRVALNELAKVGIAIRGKKRGNFRVETVTRYCAHLRDQAAGRGGEAGADARARLGQAQADLAEARAERLRGEVVPVFEVEATWAAACRSIRARVLAVADRMRLAGKPHAKLVVELRAALTDLADDPAR